jgi:hypothetical protein
MRRGGVVFRGVLPEPPASGADGRSTVPWLTLQPKPRVQRSLLVAGRLCSGCMGPLRAAWVPMRAI